MTSPIDLLTGGLVQGSGLSLTTSGLLVLQDIAPGGVSSELAERQRIDVELTFGTSAEIALSDGDLVAESSLRTALLLSLFTDARARADELVAFAAGDDPRGWALDDLAEVEGDAYGSRLWLLTRAKQTQATLDLAAEYAREAVQWIVDDGIADTITVGAAYPSRSRLGVQIAIARAAQPRDRYAFVWGG